MVKKAFQYPTLQVLAAAAAAQRINGVYRKVAGHILVGTDAEPVLQRTNRDIMYHLLQGEYNGCTITDADQQCAQDMIQHFSSLTMKAMAESLGGFETSVLEIISSETIDTHLGVAIAASLPSVMERAVGRNIVENRVRWARGGLLDIGQRVETGVEVIGCSFSASYGINFVTAISDDDRPIKFTSRTRIECGKYRLRGTVKKHMHNCSVLSRVKLYNLTKEMSCA